MGHGAAPTSECRFMSYALIFQGITLGALWTRSVSSKNGFRTALEHQTGPSRGNRSHGLGNAREPWGLPLSCSLKVVDSYVPGPRWRYLSTVHRIAARARETAWRLPAWPRPNAVRLARLAWEPSSLPGWLNEDTYTRKIRPLLKDVANSAIMSALGVSVTYAVAIRGGRHRPHPRHRLALAQLVGLPPGGAH